MVDDPELSANILEEKLHITKFDVPKQNMIRVFEHLEERAKINKALIDHGVNLEESYVAGQDLEGYFMNLLGDMQAEGGQND